MRIVLGALVLLMLAVPALAETPPLQIRYQRDALMVPKPAGWREAERTITNTGGVIRLRPDQGWLGRWRWQEEIRIEVAPALMLTEPLFYLTLLADEMQKECPQLQRSGPQLRMVGDSSAAGLELLCPASNQQKGEIAIILMLLGRDAVYLVERNWHGEPFTTTPTDGPDGAAWQEFFAGVSLTELDLAAPQPNPSPPAANN